VTFELFSQTLLPDDQVFLLTKLSDIGVEQRAQVPLQHERMQALPIFVKMG